MGGIPWEGWRGGGGRGNNVYKNEGVPTKPAHSSLGNPVSQQDQPVTGVLDEPYSQLSPLSGVAVQARQSA